MGVCGWEWAGSGRGGGSGEAGGEVGGSGWEWVGQARDEVWDMGRRRVRRHGVGWGARHMGGHGRLPAPLPACLSQGHGATARLTCTGAPMRAPLLAASAKPCVARERRKLSFT